MTNKCKLYDTCQFKYNNRFNQENDCCGDDSLALGYCGIRKDYKSKEQDMNPEQRNLIEKLFELAQPLY